MWTSALWPGSIWRGIAYTTRRARVRKYGPLRGRQRAEGPAGDRSRPCPSRPHGLDMFYSAHIRSCTMSPPKNEARSWQFEGQFSTVNTSKKTLNKKYLPLLPSWTIWTTASRDANRLKESQPSLPSTATISAADSANRGALPEQRLPRATVVGRWGPVRFSISFNFVCRIIHVSLFYVHQKSAL